jgi:hypothetical protein
MPGQIVQMLASAGRRSTWGGPAEAANWLVRKVGVEPANEVAVRRSTRRAAPVVEHSATVGVLDARFSTQISGGACRPP